MFFQMWLKNDFFWTLLEEFQSFFYYDSKNWTRFFQIRLQELNTFFNKTQRYCSNELNFCWMWLKELNFFFGAIWLKQMNLFLNLTQRIELFFWMWFNEFYFYWKKQKDSEHWNLFLILTPRIELFEKYDSLNWTLLFN